MKNILTITYSLIFICLVGYSTVFTLQNPELTRTQIGFAMPLWYWGVCMVGVIIMLISGIVGKNE